MTEVDTLLNAIDDDVDANLATVRREQIEQMLGAPPPDASPYGGSGPALPQPVSKLGLPPPAGLGAAGVGAAVPAMEPPAEQPPAEPAPAPAGVTLPRPQVELRYAGEQAPASAGNGPAAAGGPSRRAQRAGVPLWLPIVVGVVVALGALALGFVLGRARGAAEQAVRAPSPPTPSAAPVASAAPAPTSLVERASGGDPAAIKKLEAQPAPGVDAALAVSHGRMMEQRHALEKIAAQLKKKPALASDRALRHKLISAVRDPETARQALRIMATLPTSDGPDLLYETWTGTPRRTESTRLAEQLVYDKSVRARATPALAVALDLRHAKTCEDNQKLLPAAKDHGDRRSLHPLAVLQRRFGCGAHKRHDCYACLRDNDDLVDAIKAVRHRAGPKF